MATKSFTETALNSKEAKEAIGEGIVVLLQTGDFNKGWDAMMAAGQRNGSLAAVQLAISIDLLKAIAEIINGK